MHLGADRRYTGPDCPPEMLADGGIPQGDYVPVPWLESNQGWAAWVETHGAGLEFDLTAPLRISQRGAAGPFRLHLLTDPTPAARLRHYLRLTGFPPVLAEWAYGHWKSRDVYEHQRDVLDDVEGYERNGLPLDAIVIDSPWETQYNTWRFNPHQFPDPQGMLDRLREGGVRTVVWVTPWVNLDSTDGQRPPDPESERLHRRPAPNYAEGALGGQLHPWQGRRVRTSAAGGWGSGRRSTSPRRRRGGGGRSRLGTCSRWESRGSRPTTARATTSRPRRRFSDRRTGAEAGWAYGDLYRRTMQEVLDEVHPETGVLFGRCGWTGQQATGVTWGGDQVSDFWSLRTLADRDPDRGRERVLELVARRRRLPRSPAGRALPARAAPALGPVRLLHPADAGARTLRAGGVALRRPHPRHLPCLHRPP